MYGNFPGYRSKRGSVMRNEAYVYICGAQGPARGCAQGMIDSFLRNTSRVFRDGKVVDVTTMTPDVHDLETLMGEVLLRGTPEGRPYVALFFTHGDGHTAELDFLADSRFSWEAFRFNLGTGRFAFIRASENCSGGHFSGEFMRATHVHSSWEDPSPAAPPGWSGCF